MRRIKILHCVPWLTSGGVERRRLELARRLDVRRFEQQLVCLHAQSDLGAEFQSTGVRVHDMRRRFGARALYEACARARAFQPDIVHGAVFEGVILGAFAARASGARFVAEEIDYPIHRSWRGHLLLRALVTGAHTCVGVSPAVVDYLEEVAHIPRHKLRLIVNGISAPKLPTAEERASLRQALGIPGDALVVGSVGRVFDSHKRFSDLIRVTATLRQRGVSMHLVIAGDGPDTPKLRALVHELGLERHVSLLGYQSDPGKAYAQMDIFALVSDRESFGLVLVEAMFAGLPIVATRTGGIPNVVNDGETGMLIPVGDLDALAASLTRLLTEPETRARFGENGLKRAREHFSPERYVRDVEKLYLDVVPEPAPRGSSALDLDRKRVSMREP